MIRSLFVILMLNSIYLFSKCTNGKNVETIEKLKLLDTSFFNHWSYGNKGTVNMKYWYKNDDGYIKYSCALFLVNGMEEILITTPSEFAKEQNILIDFNNSLTAKVYRYKDSIVFFKINLETGEYVNAGILHRSDNPCLFQEDGIFNYLKKMGNKMDEIGIAEIHPYKRRLRFIMLDGDMLTYLPDNINEEFKRKEIEGCEMVLSGWWLYKK